MQNNQNHPAPKCDSHCFSLKALHEDRRPYFNTTTSMCLAKPTKKKKKEKSCSAYEAPIFNSDRCHATPTFILPSEKTECQAKAAEMICDHQDRVKEQEEELEDLHIPKPCSKNLYCNVCRAHYSQYIEHVISSEHRVNIRESLFNGYILDLEKKMKGKASLSMSQTGLAGNSLEDQVEIIGMRGSKRIKTINVEENYPQGIFIIMQANQGILICGQTFSQSLWMMETMRNEQFFSPFSNFTLNPYFSYWQHPMMGFPQYCLPYRPFINFDFSQRT